MVKTLAEQSLSGKRVLLREDLNVPIENGKVTSNARIDAAIPTIKYCIDAGATVIVMSHLGRPVEGEYDESLRMQPVAEVLHQALDLPVPVIKDMRGSIPTELGSVSLLENVRFEIGEKENSDQLAKQYASLCDIFVMDAFATAHRAQASTHGVAKFAPIACAGPLLMAELEALTKATGEPSRPVIAVIGGSKVSTKLDILENLAKVVDQIIVGGGIGNTFLGAAGFPLGKSLSERELIEVAEEIAGKVEVPVPIDVITTKELSKDGVATLRLVEDVRDDDIIVDIGPRTARSLSERLVQAGTIIWNGPMGVFEIDQFGEGTRVVAEAVATSQGFSVVGGGDTLAAIEKYGVQNQMSYVSTGGGAFLEFFEGKALPAVEILKQRAHD
ncbi:MAG: phosphoglycerate kinase [Pseudomonadales bacterium]|nr:phosphoglycerate kinase [Pseudomonadales bacterium]HAO55923.1 phosphoglycerate kinase [Gammaproteobacteria bacterium]